MIDGLERIIVTNCKFSASPNIARLFRTLKELFKYMRGDPRVYNFYEVHKSNMRLYSLEWLYGSDI